MKKQAKWIVTVAIMVTLGFAAAQSVDARGYGQGQCSNNETRIDEKTAAAQQKFFEDTVELRKQIVVKSAELNAQMHRQDPDAKAVGRLTGELFELRNTMRGKAEEAGLTRNGCDCSGPGSRGPGSGPGCGGMRN
ncbi:MAG: hypothetical protein L3J03_01175 [Desulfobacterales bacterium]|nr:hypothetical protein [Desulfobacterales bacterium]